MGQQNRGKSILENNDDISPLNQDDTSPLPEVDDTSPLPEDRDISPLLPDDNISPLPEDRDYSPYGTRTEETNETNEINEVVTRTNKLSNLFKNAMKRSAWRDNMALGLGGTPAIILAALGVATAYVIPNFFPGLLVAAIPSTVFGVAIPLIGGTALSAIIPLLGFALLGLALTSAVATLGYMLYNRSQRLYATREDKLQDIGRQILDKNPENIAAKALANGNFAFSPVVDENDKLVKKNGQILFNLVLTNITEEEINADDVKNILALESGFVKVHDAENVFSTSDTKTMNEWEQLLEQVVYDEHKHELESLHKDSGAVIVPKNTAEAYAIRSSRVRERLGFLGIFSKTHTKHNIPMGIDNNISDFLGNLERDKKIQRKESNIPISFSIEADSKSDGYTISIRHVNVPEKKTSSIDTAVTEAGVKGAEYKMVFGDTCIIECKDMEVLKTLASNLKENSSQRPSPRG